jgi:hypothetical protein
MQVVQQWGGGTWDSSPRNMSYNQEVFTTAGHTSRGSLTRSPTHPPYLLLVQVPEMCQAAVLGGGVIVVVRQAAGLADCRRAVQQNRWRHAGEGGGGSRGLSGGVAGLRDKAGQPAPPCPAPT